MTTFKIAHHWTLPDVEIVEIWKDGRFVAALYPSESGCRLVSSHLAGETPGVVVVHNFQFEFETVAPIQW